MSRGASSSSSSSSCEFEWFGGGSSSRRSRRRSRPSFATFLPSPSRQRQRQRLPSPRPVLGPLGHGGHRRGLGLLGGAQARPLALGLRSQRSGLRPDGVRGERLALRRAAVPVPAVSAAPFAASCPCSSGRPASSAAGIMRSFGAVASEAAATSEAEAEASKAASSEGAVVVLRHRRLPLRLAWGASPAPRLLLPVLPSVRLLLLLLLRRAWSEQQRALPRLRQPQQPRRGRRPGCSVLRWGKSERGEFFCFFC